MMSAFAGSASTDRARAREWLDYSGARYYGKNKNWNKHLVNSATLYMYNTWWRGGKRKELRACKYVPAIWISASKKSMRNADWQKSESSVNGEQQRN